MPYSDELRKCNHCGEHVVWTSITRISGYNYCPKCYNKLYGGALDNEKDEIFIQRGETNTSRNG